MTFLSGCGDKSFLDANVSCGEFEAHNCTCGGSTQNSFQHLLSTLPEPGAAAGAVTALLVLAGLRRRRQPDSNPGPPPDRM